MTFIYPSVETFCNEIKHTYGAQKYAQQNFGTYEDHIWAENSD